MAGEGAGGAKARRATTHTPAPAPRAGGPRCLVPSPANPPPTRFPAEQCPEDPTGPLELEWGAVSFGDAPGRPRVRVELAQEDAERMRGLMYRQELDEDQGMLFSWTDQRPRSFWMKRWSATQIESSSCVSAATAIARMSENGLGFRSGPTSPIGTHTPIRTPTGYRGVTQRALELLARGVAQSGSAHALGA